jgi:hypothetical protein
VDLHIRSQDRNTSGNHHNNVSPHVVHFKRGPLLAISFFFFFLNEYRLQVILRVIVIRRYVVVAVFPEIL